MMWLIIFIRFLLVSSVNSHTVSKTGENGAKKLTSSEFRDLRGKFEVALITFYHKDCPHSQVFDSIFDQAADLVINEFPNDGDVFLGKVDCAEDKRMIEDQDIIKFPTVRLYRKYSNFIHEYRGPRTVDAVLQYVGFQMSDPVVRVQQLSDLNNIDWRRRNVIGYFENDYSDQYYSYLKVAKTLRDACDFYAAIGEFAQSEWKFGNKVVFRIIGNSTDILYPSSLDNFQALLYWAMLDKCYHIVTDMTVESAEVAAEFRQPLLILFHHPDDTKTKLMFHDQVQSQLYNQITRMKFMTADGLVFRTPLKRLGKTEKDLPLIVLDTFQHMYIWSFDPKNDLNKPGLLKQFVKDLHSGKLHQLYHEQHPEEEDVSAGDDNPLVAEGKPKLRRMQGSPVESQFVKLLPSSDKYTFVLRDEL